MELRTDIHLFPLVREPASRWERAGLRPDQERYFNLVAVLLVLLFVTGWTYAILAADRADAGRDQPSVARITSRITRSPLSATTAPEPVYLINQLADRLAREFETYRGASGELNVVLQEPDTVSPLATLPDSLPPGAELELRPAAGTEGQAIEVDDGATRPGIWNVMLRMRDAIRPVSDVSVISLVPLSERRDGRIGQYLVGEWPFEEGGAPRPVYEPPSGVVRVTPENENLRVSEHFVLGDFLTKGQADVWPKYVVISTRLLDKLELTLQELEADGHPVENVFVVSGFRTPVYNETGGNTQGRASLSRHMYGDAADIAIDNNRDRRMDDLNGDGVVDLEDAHIVAEAAARVEQEYPHLVGGIGIYAPTGAHAGMVHVDTRGFRARWGEW